MNESARERIMAAAEELFCTAGFDATPTSRIAERAGVPKGLVHYYFRRKSDLLPALLKRLPREHVDHSRVVVSGDILTTLRRLVAELDTWLESSELLSHLLWREADTHEQVRAALADRYTWMVQEIKDAIHAALRSGSPTADVDSAAELLALAVSYRHSTARLTLAGVDWTRMERELVFVADALDSGAGFPSRESP